MAKYEHQPLAGRAARLKDKMDKRSRQRAGLSLNRHQRLTKDRRGNLAAVAKERTKRKRRPVIAETMLGLKQKAAAIENEELRRLTLEAVRKTRTIVYGDILARRSGEKLAADQAIKLYLQRLDKVVTILESKLADGEKQELFTRTEVEALKTFQTIASTYETSGDLTPLITHLYQHQNLLEALSNNPTIVALMDQLIPAEALTAQLDETYNQLVHTLATAAQAAPAEKNFIYTRLLGILLLLMVLTPFIAACGGPKSTAPETNPRGNPALAAENENATEEPDILTPSPESPYTTPNSLALESVTVRGSNLAALEDLLAKAELSPMGQEGATDLKLEVNPSAENYGDLIELLRKINPSLVDEIVKLINVEGEPLYIDNKSTGYRIFFNENANAVIELIIRKKDDDSYQLAVIARSIAVIGNEEEGYNPGTIFWLDNQAYINAVSPDSVETSGMQSAVFAVLVTAENINTLKQHGLANDIKAGEIAVINLSLADANNLRNNEIEILGLNTQTGILSADRLTAASEEAGIESTPEASQTELDKIKEQCDVILQLDNGDLTLTLRAYTQGAFGDADLNLITLRPKDLLTSMQTVIDRTWETHGQGNIPFLIDETDNSLNQPGITNATISQIDITIWEEGDNIDTTGIGTQFVRGSKKERIGIIHDENDPTRIEVVVIFPKGEMSGIEENVVIDALTAPFFMSLTPEATEFANRNLDTGMDIAGETTAFLEFAYFDILGQDAYDGSGFYTSGPAVLPLKGRKVPNYFKDFLAAAVEANGELGDDKADLLAAIEAGKLTDEQITQAQAALNF